MACSMADSAVLALAPSGPTACTARLACVRSPQSERDHRSPAHAKRAGGASGQIDATSLHERTTIIYPHGDASAA